MTACSNTTFVGTLGKNFARFNRFGILTDVGGQTCLLPTAKLLKSGFKVEQVTENTVITCVARSTEQGYTALAVEAVEAVDGRAADGRPHKTETEVERKKSPDSTVEFVVMKVTTLKTGRPPMKSVSAAARAGCGAGTSP